jgi:hypothetical protein
MACVRIKSEGKSNPGALIRKARSKAARLLEGSDRVLVVFDKEAAKIYYEPEPVAPNGERRH